MNIFALTITILTLVSVSPFSHRPTSESFRKSLKLHAREKSKAKYFPNEFAAALIASSLVLTQLPLSPVNAYEDSDYASDTVKQTVKALQDAGTNSDEVFKTYENIAAIITEGKGVGGSINYRK